MKRRPPLPEPRASALLAAVLAAAPACAQETAPDPAPVPAPPAAPTSAPAAPAPAVATPVAQATQPVPGGQPAPAGQQPPAQLGDVQIFGDEITRDPVTGLTTVTGNPRVVRGDQELRATRLIIGPSPDQVTAEGNVIIRRGTQEFFATRAVYNFADQAGQAENGRTILGTYYVDAEQLLLKPGPVYEARRATFTTCDQEKPHYSIFGRSLEIIPEQRLTGRHVGVNFLGRRLFTLPRFSRSLRPDDDESEDRSLYPSLGYSSFYGPYLRKDLNLLRRDAVWLDAEVQLNTLHEPNGGILAATPGRPQIVGALYYRDTAENQRSSHLEVSRLPEVGVVWAPRQRPRPGRFLAHQVVGVGYPDPLEDVSTKWRFSGMVSGGYFRQHHGEDFRGPDSRSKSGARLVVHGQAVQPLVPLGPIRLNNLRLLARQSVYDTGDAFTLFGTGIGKRWRLGRFRLEIQRFDQWTIGNTPFLFDDVELEEEWRPSLQYRSRGFEFSYIARLRNSGKSFDQIISVSKLFHCIEPRLTYRTRRQEFFLEIRIPGLSGGSRTRPGEPRTSPENEMGVGR